MFAVFFKADVRWGFAHNIKSGAKDSSSAIGWNIDCA